MTPRRVRERLQLLTGRRLTHRFQYAVPGEGTMNYYTLSKEGYRVLHGQDVTLPGHRAFEALSISRLPHTQALADVIVHTAVAAHRSGVALHNFHREGSLKLQVEADFLYPDSTFRLVTSDGRTFDFFIELDNGTEAIFTHTGNGSFERKIRFYESYKDQCKARGLDHRFRVALVTTGTETRLCHLLACVQNLLRVKERPLVYGSTLRSYLDCAAPLASPCFRDHAGQVRALLPAAPAILHAPARALALPLAAAVPV
jgi:hypothetical protein